MSNLHWRTADVELGDKLIPNPNAEHQLLDRLTNVLVAVEGAFLHIDARPNGQPAYPGQDTYDVHIVPAHLARRVTYKAELKKASESIEVRSF
ncbi:hypothetical protein [Streptomyces sp. F-1]|uniref:hypothetical protein n=1 Tax=Streptomyces sp. F-1 TaxID=463642 RepID=UPI00085CB6BB|nr:hypothetical protein [Streptomyces sp. F-1]SFY52081.1 hypothetical protein STEPF1_05350 [Streptomyces sp. F-1]